MFTRISDFLRHLAHESSKVSNNMECPFCRQKLDKDCLKAFKVRLGRMQFVFRVYEETTSKRAYDYLYEVFVEPAGRDVPDGKNKDPDWWSDLARELYKEEAKSKAK